MRQFSSLQGWIFKASAPEGRLTFYMDNPIEKCAFLYSEEQGCFHHDPPDSLGDSRYRLIAGNVVAAKCLAFSEYMVNLHGEECEWSFDYIKSMWLLFQDIEIDPKGWWGLVEFFIQSRNRKADEY